MKKNTRVILVDALRGFALLGIVLIHHVQHFDFFHDPDIFFFFNKITDQIVLNIVQFFISGKAYSIFAIMFGFSFYIQMSRQEERGVDFRWRFIWRLTILMILGFLHSLIYKGDILLIYALLGFPLVFLYKRSIKTLVWISVLFALQIPIIYQLIQSIIDPSFEWVINYGSVHEQESNAIYASGNFAEVVQYNIWKGRAIIWNWMYYDGRFMQLIALFTAGLALGRKQYFENIFQYKKDVQKYLSISIVAIIFITIFGMGILLLPLPEAQQYLSLILMKSYWDLCATAIIMCIFILFYIKHKESRWIDWLSTYGKMSLSNYVFQSILGVVVFFEFGLGLYHYLGSTWSLIYGALFFVLQVWISKMWIKHFYYGPLEWIWRALTFFNFNIKMRKSNQS